MDFFQVIAFIDNEISNNNDDGIYVDEDFEKDIKQQVKRLNLHELYESLIKYIYELLYREYVGEVETNKYFSVIKDIKDVIFNLIDEKEVCGDETISESELKKLLSCSVKYRKNQIKFCSYSIKNYKRENLRFESYFFFKETIKDLDIKLDERFKVDYFDNIDGIKRIHNYIEELIEKAGAEEFFFYLNSTLSEDFHEELQVFTVSKPSTGQIKDADPKTPFGYLLNVCIKQLKEIRKSRKTILRDDVERFEKIINVALKLGCLLDLTAYNSYHILSRGSMKVDRKLLNQELYENVAYDSIFMFDQYPAKSISYLVRNVFKDVENEFDFDLSTDTIANIIDAIAELFTVNGVTKKASTFSQKKLVRKILDQQKNLKKSDVDTFLDLFSIDISKLNKNFSHPLDYEEVNAHFYQIYKVDNSRYMIINPSIFSLSYFSLLRHEYLGKSKNKKDSLIGSGTDEIIAKDNFEKLIRDLFVDKGFYTYKGHFGNGNETDLVVESKNNIYVIECKIGTYAREAKSVNIMKLYKNLDVLFKSQRQAYAVEYFLKKNGSIEFNDKGFKKRLYLKGRSVVKISLSLYDFLGFQDMTFVSYLIKELYGIQLILKDKEKKSLKIIEKFNENLEKITEYIKGIAERNKKVGLTTDLIQITNNSMFLCYGHLYLMMQFVKKPSDLDSIMPLVHTSGTQNFYCELKESLLLEGKVKLRDGEKMSEKIFIVRGV